MDKFIAMLFRVALAPIVQALIGGLGPNIRTLLSFGLKSADIATVMDKVATKYTGGSPTYAPMGTLTSVDQQDVVEGINLALKAVLTDYGVTLTAAQVSQVLVAVAAQIQLRHPATP